MRSLAVVVLVLAAGCGPRLPELPAGRRAAPAEAPAAPQALTVEPDPDLPAYVPVDPPVSGALTVVGSDTLNNVMASWGTAFSRIYPAAVVQVEGKGSSTAPPALTEGTAQLGPMSREMKSTELDRFVERHGYAPTRLSVGIDAVGIFVHRGNPVASLDLPQVDAVFSSTRRRGGSVVTTWGDVGLQGEWEQAPLRLYGRNAASGTYGFVKDVALAGGDFADHVKEQPGSAAVVQGITEDRFGIGYSGVGYLTSSVRLVPIAPATGAEPVPPTPENIYSERYPLARPLLVYVNDPPVRPLSPLVREFLRFGLSRDGQALVAKDGYLPLDAETAAEEAAKLE